MNFTPFVISEKTTIAKKEKKPIRWWYPATIIIVLLALASLVTTMVVLHRKLNSGPVIQIPKSSHKVISDKDVSIESQTDTDDHSTTEGESKDERDIIPLDPTDVPHLNNVPYWRKIMARNARVGYVFCGGAMKYISHHYNFSGFNWGQTFAESSISYLLYYIIQCANENNGTDSNVLEDVAFKVNNTSATSFYKKMGFNILFCNQRSIGLRSSSPAGEFTYKRSMETFILRHGMKTEIIATTLGVGSKTGTWTTVTTGISLLSSTVQDSSLTFTFAEPSTTIIVLISSTQAATGSTFDIYVDDVLNTSGSNTSQAGINPAFAMMSIRLSNLSNTNHVIKVVKTGATGTLHVYSCYTYVPIVSPTYICKEYYALPAGYATFTPPPTDADIDRYNGYIDQVVDSFPPEIKNNITVIDINTRWNKAIHLSFDSLSPNDLGTRLITDMILDKLAEREIRLGSHIVRADYNQLLPSLTENEDYWVNRYRRDYKNARLWYYTQCRCYGHEFNLVDVAETYSTTSFTKYVMMFAYFAYHVLAGGINDTMEDTAMLINGGVGYTIRPQGYMGVITLMANQYNVCTRSHIPLAPASFKRSLKFFIAKCASRETTSATVSKKTGIWNTIRLLNAGGLTASYQSSTTEGSSIEFNFEFPSTALAIVVYGVMDESGSTYDVFVDNELKKSGTTSSQSILGNRADWAAAPGVPKVVLIRNLEKKKHSIKIVKTGSSGTLHVDSAFVYNAEEAPYLIILKDTYCAPSGYARFTVSNPTDATVDEYNKYIDDVVTMFPERKTSIKVLNPNGSGWDPQIHILSDRDDGQHPNDLGTRFLAEMVIDDLSNIEIQKGTHYIK